MNPSSTTLPPRNADSEVRAFTTSGIRFVETMGFLEVLSFLGEGVGAALYILGIITGQPMIAVLGILFVAAAIAALLVHLGPRTFIAWRALAKIKTSWVSRGTLFMSIFMAFSVCALGAAYIDALGSLQRPLTAGALVFAPLVIIYAGMMLRSMRAVGLWRSMYLPSAFSAHSLATALTVVCALSIWSEPGIADIGWLLPAAIGFLILSVIISVLHLAFIKRSAGIRASINRLFAGDLRGRLRWGAGMVGTVIPLGGLATALVTGAAGKDAVVPLIVAAICRLFGDYAYRSSIVTAGAYEPIVPPPSRRY